MLSWGQSLKCTESVDTWMVEMLGLWYIYWGKSQAPCATSKRARDQGSPMSLGPTGSHPKLQIVCLSWWVSVLLWPDFFLERFTLCFCILQVRNLVFTLYAHITIKAFVWISEKESGLGFLNNIMILILWELFRCVKCILHYEIVINFWGGVVN